MVVTDVAEAAVTGLSGRLRRIERKLAELRPVVPKDGIAWVMIQEDLHADGRACPKVERKGHNLDVLVPRDMIREPLENILSPEQRAMLLPWVKVITVVYADDWRGQR